MARDLEREAILRAAKEMGIDPSLALAVAERESNFDPGAKSSSTIRGIFQMNGGARAAHGVGDSTDPYTQAKGWGSFMRDVKREMAGPLGREPTGPESYLGHHFGGVRAGRMLKMDPDTPVEAVFTPREMRENPHFAKAGTVGELNRSVMADIERRQAKYGGEGGETPAIPDTASPVGFENAAASPPVAASATDVAAASPPATPAATSQAGPNSFKGLPNFDSPSIEHPTPLPRPTMPQITLGGIPTAPRAPAQAMPTPDPMAIMLGQMANDPTAKQVEESNLMGIPV